MLGNTHSALSIFNNDHVEINKTFNNYFKQTQRTCGANPAGENSSFISTVCVRSVPFYHSKLAYVVLHMFVKDFFSDLTSKNGEIGCFNLHSHF